MYNGSPRMYGLLLPLVAELATGPAFSDEVHRFNIDPTDLRAAIREFGNESGVNVIVPGDELEGKQLNAVRGTLSVEDALKRLLAGTGLTYRFGDGGAVILTAAGDHGQGNPAQVHSASKSPPQTVRSPRDEEAPLLLEEIVVTAQKRTENLQEVPISGQVVGGQTLAEHNFNTLAQLTEIVPGVHVGTGSVANTFSDQLFVRGIGSGNNQGFDQSVATFVDDIYHGRSRMTNATFLDLDRIEILKGPQSTFFGDNAIAGALNIVTQTPGDTFDAYMRTLYGMYGQYAAEGAVTIPFTDTLSVRAAGIFDGGRGWIRNVNTGEHAPADHNRAGRWTFLFKPTANLDVTLKLEGSENTVSGTVGNQPLQYGNCPPPAPLTPGFAGNCAQALALGVPIGPNTNANTGLGGQGSELSTVESVLTVNYRDWGHTFSSISGYYAYQYDTRQDNANLPVWINTYAYPENYHQSSQEFRVASPTGQPIEYLAGVYFHTDGLTIPLEAGGPFLNFLGADPFFPALAPYLPLAVTLNSSQTERVYSMFGSLKWNILDQLSFNAGLRGTRVTKDFSIDTEYGTATQIYGGFLPLPAAVEALPSLLFGPPHMPQHLKRSDQALMPSAGFQYHIEPEVMAYVSYARGFKAGGFNSETIGLPENIDFGPEHVDAYELGLKSKWLDDTVLANIDVFLSDYRGLQVAVDLPIPDTTQIQQAVRNAASSRSQGIELETQWLVTRNFRLSANATYLEAYYVSYPNAAPSTLQAFCGASYVLPQCSIYPNPVPGYASLAGQPSNYAPRWSGSVSANYSINLPHGFQLTTKLSPYMTSSYFAAGASGNDSYLRLGGYTRLDGTLTLSSREDRWQVDLIGKNLTDRIIVTSIVLPLETKEEPRNIALQFRYRF